MLMISKSDAKEQGLKRFFTGLPCSKGHIAERTVSRNDCVECLNIRKVKWARANSESSNEKSRVWYRDNKEHAYATRLKWREENKEKFKADIKKYQILHKDRLYAMSLIWRANNPDKVKESHDKSTARNKEAILRRGAEWRKRNRDKVNAKKKYRESRKQNATPAWADAFLMREIYHLAKLRNEICGGEWHVDHIVPLNSKLVCGLHCEANLNAIPAAINRMKSNRTWPDMP